MKDLQEFMHQSRLCQSEDDFFFCKGMASFQEGAARAAEGQDWERKEV